MSDRDRLLIQYQGEPCAGCLEFTSQPKNHAHHGVGRRVGSKIVVEGMAYDVYGMIEKDLSSMLTLGDLLWDRHNILPVHDRCHVPESPFLRLYSAVILSVRMYREERRGPDAIIEWLNGLRTKVQVPVPKALARVNDLWDTESRVACPMCREYHLHYVHTENFDLLVEDFATGGAVICWRCVSAACRSLAR